MSLVDAVLLRRADEQMVTAWHKVTESERRELESHVASEGRTCAVPGCYKPIPKTDKHWVCRTCRHNGLVAAPCKCCGGPLRRIDQTHKEPRRGICQKCRSAMPVPKSTGCWAKGVSGNPTGKANRSAA